MIELDFGIKQSTEEIVEKISKINLTENIELDIGFISIYSEENQKQDLI